MLFKIINQSWHHACSPPQNICMCILDDGKIVLLRNENEVIMYNMLKDTYNKVMNLTRRRLRVVEYAESCASLSLEISSLY